MKIATFNVNGVKGRMPRLLEWLAEAQPDVACLQEIKTGDSTFPAEPLHAAGYEVIWHGMPRHHGVAILARGSVPRELRRGLPGDDADGQARYLEARLDGLRIASVYLPNGNPVPSPNFDYKLAWFERLTPMPVRCWTRAATSCWPAISTWCPPTRTSTTPAPGASTPCCNPGRGTRGSG